MNTAFATVAAICGLIGVAFALVGVLVSALAFRGYQGERYDLRNHFISELGETGISQAAWVFNGSLVATGLALTVFMIGAGLYTDHWLGYLAGAAGLASSIACAAVGILPMNKLSAHIKAALVFFNAGQLSALLFSLYLFVAQAIRLPRWLIIPAGLSTVAFVAFLRTPYQKDTLEAFGKDRQTFARPQW